MAIPTTEPSGGLRATLCLYEDSGITYVIFRGRAIQENAHHSYSERWPTGSTRLPDLGEVLASGGGYGAETHVVRVRRAICHVRLAEGYVYATVAAKERPEVETAREALHRALPPAQLPAQDQPMSRVAFWYRTPRGAELVQRNIAVPTWSGIEMNYPAATQSQLASLMTGWRPGSDGRLLLWHGPPGSGKTYAARALAWEWREWCEPHYVIDPENLLGIEADYMLQVLLDEQRAEDELSHNDGSSSSHRARWRLLILEDAGEFLTVDAKERAGQALARLLNLTDGLLGQGLRLLVLITTNEPLPSHHPAVARPGRCAAVVEFGRLSANETAAWLRHHDHEDIDRQTMALADLYATIRGRARLPKPTVGFA